jgi:EAL domain-containing protein (putative c-di-GMP-specific phosphodiesterase class I)/ActR/RegA family two-component response regulator
MNAAREWILLVDDDPAITESLAMMLEREGRTTLICADVDAAEILLERYPITHLVSDVQFSGEFGFEGLHFLSHAHRFAPRCRVVLMSGQVTEALDRTARCFGASEVLAKPFGMDELERALGSRGIRDKGEYEIIRFPAAEEILASEELTVAFQPIVCVREGSSEVFAYEALARVPGEWMPGGPETLFKYAGKRDRLVELNLATLTRGFHGAAFLPGNPYLFVNLDPAVFTSRALVPTLRNASERSGVSLARTVLEVTEHSAFSDEEKAALAFEQLRALGVRFALDDHASAYSHLALIDRIRPSFMKISNAFGTDFDTDTTRGRIVRHVVALARDLGCEPIVEGIESEATARAARELGVELLQGYYYGRPNAAAHWVAAGVASARPPVRTDHSREPHRLTDACGVRRRASAFPSRA